MTFLSNTITSASTIQKQEKSTGYKPLNGGKAVIELDDLKPVSTSPPPPPKKKKKEKLTESTR